MNTPPASPSSADQLADEQFEVNAYLHEILRECEREDLQYLLALAVEDTGSCIAPKLCRTIRHLHHVELARRRKRSVTCARIDLDEWTDIELGSAVSCATSWCCYAAYASRPGAMEFAHRFAKLANIAVLKRLLACRANEK